MGLLGLIIWSVALVLGTRWVTNYRLKQEVYAAQEAAMFLANKIDALEEAYPDFIDAEYEEN